MTATARPFGVVPRPAWARRLHPPLLLAGALAITGCASLEVGVSGREAELARQRAAEGVTLIHADERRVVFAAGGRRVAIEPPEGYCLVPDSVAATRRAGFVLVADCMDGSEHPVFPGILTVSIWSEPGYGMEGGIEAFERLLEDDKGRRLLGRGQNRAPGRVTATRRIGDALYVLVEETPDGSNRILLPRFWRAFLEINRRLVLVTVSGFADRPVGEDAMLAFAVAEVARLRRANGQPLDPEEVEIAATALAWELPEPRGEKGSVVSLDTPWMAVPPPPRKPRPSSARAAEARPSPAPFRSPRPPARPG